MQRVSTAAIRYRLAATADRAAIVELLERDRLPTADLDASGVVLLLAESEGRVVGCIGIQPLGDAGIIRSLAVAPDHRRAGIGRTLASRAEALAAGGGLHGLYLLTENARDFWANAGYAAVPRAQAPPEVRASAEFRALCPDTAVCMTRVLKAG